MCRPAISIAIIVRGSVIGRAPMVISWTPIGVTVPAVRRAKTKAYAPSVPWIVAYRKSVSVVMMVIVPPVPWIIIVACTVNYGRPIHVRTIVTWRIPYIDHGGRCLVDIYIFSIVLWVFCRYFLYLIGSLICYLPWPIGRSCPKPNGVIT